MKRFPLLLLLLLGAAPGLFSQVDIEVNGSVADNSCMYVRTVQGRLDTMQGKWVGIYHAAINGNCLELGILYGGCKPQMEFLTDNVLLTTQGYKMNFLLKYMKYEACRDTMKTKLSFDLYPYKNVRPGNVIFISLMGTPFNLGYRQMD